MTSLDQKTTELMLSAETIVSDAFINPSPYGRVKVVKNVGLTSPGDYELGTVAESNNELRVELDSVHLDDLRESFELEAADIACRSVDEYIAVSIYAAHLLQKNLGSTSFVGSEVSEEFYHYTKDSSRIIATLQATKPIEDTFAHTAIKRSEKSEPSLYGRDI